MFGLQSLLIILSPEVEVEAPRPVATPARLSHTEPMASASKPNPAAGSAEDIVQPNADVAVPTEEGSEATRPRKFRPVLSMRKTRQVT